MVHTIITILATITVVFLSNHVCPYFSCSSPADKDLLFVDMDIDTKPEDIKFESRATPNGELVYTEDPSKRVSLSNIVLKSLNLCHKVSQNLLVIKSLNLCHKVSQSLS